MQMAKIRYNVKYKEGNTPYSTIIEAESEEEALSAIKKKLQYKKNFEIISIQQKK
jgi:hypothetical protein